MDRRIVFIVVVGLAAVAAFFTTLHLRRSPSSPPATVSQTRPTDPPPATRESPRTEAPIPETPITETPPATVRRAPARKPTPSPPTASAPVPAASPEVGTLRIDSDVRGAQVFIDREYIGVTPVSAQNIQPGTHRLNVSAEGYDGVAETIEVSPGGARDVVIKLREVRLDSRADVVHKHRLGSCRGRLIATPQGLRYETHDKDDAFSAALLDLETFEVDYLAKNLRVKPRKGKQYDFTDPDGTADRLFVFHRDTEKARARLKKGDPPGE